MRKFISPFIQQGYHCPVSLLNDEDEDATANISLVAYELPYQPFFDSLVTLDSLDYDPNRELSFYRKVKTPLSLDLDISAETLLKKTIAACKETIKITVYFFHPIVVQLSELLAFSVREFLSKLEKFFSSFYFSILFCL